MAELDNKFPLGFAAAASALTLSTGRKLIRNFNYYRSGELSRVTRAELIAICRDIRKDAFSLHNLMENREEYAPFFVALAGQISDRYEELHRKLLYFDPDLITEAIRLIDRQRSFWKKSDNPGFYSVELVQLLEHFIPDMLLKIESELKRLPVSAIL